MEITLFVVLYWRDGAERVHKTNDGREATLFAQSANGVIYVLAPSATSAISALALALGGAIAPSDCTDNAIATSAIKKIAP